MAKRAFQTFFHVDLQRRCGKCNENLHNRRYLAKLWASLGICRKKQTCSFSRHHHDYQLQFNIFGQGVIVSPILYVSSSMKMHTANFFRTCVHDIQCITCFIASFLLIFRTFLFYIVCKQEKIPVNNLLLIRFPVTGNFSFFPKQRVYDWAINK